MSAKERPSRAWSEGEGEGEGGEARSVVFYEGLRLWEARFIVLCEGLRFWEARLVVFEFELEHGFQHQRAKWARTQPVQT